MWKNGIKIIVVYSRSVGNKQVICIHLYNSHELLNGKKNGNYSIMCKTICACKSLRLTLRFTKRCGFGSSDLNHDDEKGK